MRHERTLSSRRGFLAPLCLKAVSGDGLFSGYASVFGEVDLGKDVIEPGAFLASLAKRGADGVRMLFQHDPAEPIGRWLSIREDGRGLFVEGQLTLGAAKADEVFQHLKSRSLDGLSIGFRTVRARREAKSGIRHILEADLWEISVVTFPMLPSARVGQVKHMPEGPDLARKMRRARNRILSSLPAASGGFFM